MRKWYGVIGDPIEQSLSPLMQEFWFGRAGLDAHYEAFHVTKDNLARAVAGLKALGAGGFNVTVPHKSAIIPFLDETDKDARIIGAVNTVVRADGRLIGYNTDGIGFLKSVETRFPQLCTGKPSALILGAGGAAKAVAVTLAKDMAGRVDVCNRTLAKAAVLSETCGKFCLSEAFGPSEAEKRLRRYDMVINCTSVGLNPDTDAPVIDIGAAKRDTLFADLIYKPFRTALLRRAERMGNPVLNGLPMLICQGAYAFKKWTGFMPDVPGAEKLLQGLFLK